MTIKQQTNPALRPEPAPRRIFGEDHEPGALARFETRLVKMAPARGHARRR